jgi:undecaprenyl-diphosphatase
MFYTIFFGFLIFLVMKYTPRTTLRAIALLLLGGIILLVGPSRMYLGAHWLSDVVAGYLIGLVYLGWAIVIYRWLCGKFVS